VANSVSCKLAMAAFNQAVGNSLQKRSHWFKKPIRCLLSCFVNLNVLKPTPLWRKLTNFCIFFVSFSGYSVCKSSRFHPANAGATPNWSHSRQPPAPVAPPSCRAERSSVNRERAGFLPPTDRVYPSPPHAGSDPWKSTVGR